MKNSILAFAILALAFVVTAPLSVEAQPGRGRGWGNSPYKQRVKERRKIEKERAKFVRKVEQERFKNAVRNRARSNRDYRAGANVYTRRQRVYTNQDPYYNGPYSNDPYYNGRIPNDPYYNGRYPNDPYYGQYPNDPYYDPYYNDYYYRDRSFYQRHRNAINIGIAAGTGAVVGGIVNGKKGALIGAGVGAAAGAVYTYGINPKNRRPRIYYPD